VAYLGNTLQVAFPSYRNIDDVSGSFNGVTTTFPLRVSGAAPVPFPISSNQCLISVGGVVQRPDDSGTEGFRISGTNIIFSSAPASGADFFGVILAGADYVNVGANFPSGSATVPSITFDNDLDTGIYNPNANEIGFTTAGTARLIIDANGQVRTGGLGTANNPVYTFNSDPNTGIYSPGADQVSISTNGTERLRIDATGQVEAVSLGTAAAPVYSFTTDPNTGLYSPGADQVAISTNGTGRLFVDSSGRVGVNTSSPSQRLHIYESIAETGAFARIEEVGGQTAFFGVNTIGGSVQVSGNNPFQIATNGTERLRVTGAGLVGLGTSSPSQLLHVAGNARIGANDSSDALLEIGAGATGNRSAYIDFTGDTTYSDYGLRIIRQASGANSDTDILHRGTGSLKLKALEAGSLTFSTNDTTRLFINSSGNVGIGTATPDQPMTLNAANGYPVMSFQNNGTTVGDIGFNVGLGMVLSGRSTNPILFYTNSSERGRWDSSGRFLVGTSTSGSTGSAQYARLQVQGNTGGSTNGGMLALMRQQAATAPLNANDLMGLISFADSSGNEFATILCAADATTAAGDYPGRLTFSTTADGASGPTERMRIQADGQIRVTNNNTNIVYVNTGANGTALCYFQTASTELGKIRINGAGVAYDTTSDYRLKENIEPITGAIDRVQALKPWRFNFISCPGLTVDGFLAHEAQEVVPEAVGGTKDEVDADGNPVYQGIDQSKLVPLLTAALQEALQKIEDLETRLTAAGL
jgi:hypothetical protein